MGTRSTRRTPTNGPGGPASGCAASAALVGRAPAKEDVISIYFNAYLSKSKKFETKAVATDKGTVALDINVFDGIKLDLTPEQWVEVITAVTAALPKGSRTPANDDY